VDEAKWLEVSLTVDGELAESIVEVLDRFLVNGVVIESTTVQQNNENEGTPFGPVKVFGYLFIDGQTDDKRKRIEEALGHLNLIQPVPEQSTRKLPTRIGWKPGKSIMCPSRSEKN